MGEQSTRRDPCREWIARAIHRGLELDVLKPPDVLVHATPDVLAEHLPPELVTKILDDGLSAGSLTPQGVLGSTPAAVLASHVPLRILWEALEAAAERSDLSRGVPK